MAQMRITYMMDEQGGFTAGDRATTRTAYAYPTSPHATMARTMPERVAREMLKAANACSVPEDIRRDYDGRHWHAMFLASPSRSVDVD